MRCQRRAAQMAIKRWGIVLFASASLAGCGSTASPSPVRTKPAQAAKAHQKPRAKHKTRKAPERKGPIATSPPPTPAQEQAASELEGERNREAVERGEPEPNPPAPESQEQETNDARLAEEHERLCLARVGVADC